METYNNYKKYLQYKPEYPQWKQQNDLKDARRQEYLKRHPQEINNTDIQRGKALLHAIDIMDEYSQKNAEDMEIATEFAAGQAMGFVQMLGFGAGLAATLFPPVQKGLSGLKTKFPKIKGAVELLPLGIGYLASIIASFPIMSWAAKMQVGASRKGRFEAMRKDLVNPNNFAVLTDEQRKKVEEDAKNITLEEEKKKKHHFDIGIKESFSNLKKLAKRDKDYERQKIEFEEALNKHEKNFDKKLSNEDIKTAKKDQQLLSKLVQKIDIASQDYAENVEMATNLATLAAVGSGLLTGWISSKVSKLLKLNPNNKVTVLIPWIVGVGTMLLASTGSAKVQKQASRVGRFKVKQELAQNPNELVYVDDEKANSMTDVKQPETKKKPNFFKFLIQAYKDNKEYEKYMKEEGLKEKKIYKAMEELKLTEEQEKEAKALQQNTFKTFNKVDDKSQTYAESVEALGQSMGFPVALIGMALGSGFGVLMSKKSFTKMAKVAEKDLFRVMMNSISKLIIPMICGFIPSALMEIYITKEQKRASRIADMLAIKDLEDYRHYAHYDNLKLDAAESSNQNTEQTTVNKSLLSVLKAKA